MNDSDGKSQTLLPELIMQAIQSSESGKAENTTSHQSHQKQIRDFKCHTFAFIGGEEPHFIFSSANGVWGRLYVTPTQIALSVENGSRFIGDLVRAGSRT